MRKVTIKEKSFDNDVKSAFIDFVKEDGMNFRDASSMVAQIYNVAFDEVVEMLNKMGITEDMDTKKAIVEEEKTCYNCNTPQPGNVPGGICTSCGKQWDMGNMSEADDKDDKDKKDDDEDEDKDKDKDKDKDDADKEKDKDDKKEATAANTQSDAEKDKEKAQRKADDAKKDADKKADAKKKADEEIITVEEDVEIGDIVLEKGDRFIIVK